MSKKSNPYLKSANTEETYTHKEVMELRKCYEDPIYFIKNYVKIVHPTDGIILFDLFDYQEEMVNAFYEERYNIVLSARQTGKALDIKTPIPTPSGWTTIEDIQIGDIIFDEKGNPTNVIDTTDIMLDHTCYNIEFSNNENIIADAGHLWKVNDTFLGFTRILTTEDMVNIGNGPRPDGKTCRYSIDTTPGLNLPENNLPIDPYILGTWLGDGTSANEEHTVHQKDLSIYNIHAELYEDLYTIPIKNREYLLRVRSKNLRKDLKNLELLKNKHIPNIYLRSSFEQRISLLQGLMDTDEYVDYRNGGYEISQSNDRLAFDIYELLCSLGLKPTLKRKISSGFWSNRIIFTAYKDDFNVFNLSRKLKNQKQFPAEHRELSTKRRSILSISEVDSVPVKCITVDNKKHLFLAGKSMIPTHNCVSEDTNINIVDANNIPWYKKAILRLIDNNTYGRIYKKMQK